MLANSVVTTHSCSLYFDAHLLFHIFNHSVVSLQKGDLSLHTSLEQLLDVCCSKDRTSFIKNSISRLYREEQTLQLAIRNHCLTTLAIQSALTSVPQIGGT